MARGRPRYGTTRSGLRVSLPDRYTPRLESVLSRPLTFGPTLSLEDLQDVEDRRLWHPDPDRGAVTIGGNWARVVVHKRPFVARSKTFSSWIGGRGMPIGFQVPVGLRFESPLKVLTCVRRKIRRQVIFARGLRHKGAGARRRRRGPHSSVAC